MGRNETVSEMTLTEVFNDKSLSCGPAAIAAVTGRSYREVKCLIDYIHADKENGTAGTFPWVISLVLETMEISYSQTYYSHNERPYLTDKIMGGIEDGTYIVGITGRVNHCLAVSIPKDDIVWIVDSHFNSPVSFRSIGMRKVCDNEDNRPYDASPVDRIWKLYV